MKIVSASAKVLAGLFCVAFGIILYYTVEIIAIELLFPFAPIPPLDVLMERIASGAQRAEIALVSAMRWLLSGVMRALGIFLCVMGYRWFQRKNKLNLFVKVVLWGMGVWFITTFYCLILIVLGQYHIVNAFSYEVQLVLFPVTEKILPYFHMEDLDTVFYLLVILIHYTIMAAVALPAYFAFKRWKKNRLPKAETSV